MKHLDRMIAHLLYLMHPSTVLGQLKRILPILIMLLILNLKLKQELALKLNRLTLTDSLQYNLAKKLPYQQTIRSKYKTEP